MKLLVETTTTAPVTTFIVQYRSRATGNLFSKGYIGSRQDVERYHRDCTTALDCFVVSVTEQ